MPRGCAESAQDGESNLRCGSIDTHVTPSYELNNTRKNFRNPKNRGNAVPTSPTPSRRRADRADSPRPSADRLRSTVQSLAKGFRILEVFGGDSDELTLSEVALAAGLDPGTAHRMLNTIVDLGYIERVPDTRRFRLTLKVLDLGFHAIAHRDIRSLVRPALRRLVSETNEAASFGILNGADVLYLERVRAGLTRLGVDIRVGTTVPAQHSIIGHCILAFRDEGAAAPLAGRAGARSLPPGRSIDGSELEQSLAEIRRDGFALRPSTLSEGLRILAVPVKDMDGLALGAISVAAPASRLSEAAFAVQALEPALSAARQIARAIEASGSVETKL